MSRKEYEFEILIRENLEGLEDSETVLLKGHLVIEQLLTRLLELSLMEPERLKKIRPMFATKLELYLAIVGNSIISNGLEKVLRELNALRNILAHNLNHQEFEIRLEKWIEMATRQRLASPNSPGLYKEQLITAVSRIAAFLSGVIESKVAFRKHI